MPKFRIDYNIGWRNMWTDTVEEANYHDVLDRCENTLLTATSIKSSHLNKDGELEQGVVLRIKDITHITVFPVGEDEEE